MPVFLLNPSRPDPLKIQFPTNNPHTTDCVIRASYRKLHVNCATAAVSVAVRERLVEELPAGD
jgi:hypothetical protein